MRPEFVTQEDLERWNDRIKNDPGIPEGFGETEKELEVLYAGIWIYEQLTELECPETDIQKIQYIAGHLSRDNDTWTVAQQAVDIYKTALNDITSQLTTSELDDYDNLYEDDSDLN